MVENFGMLQIQHLEKSLFFKSDKLCLSLTKHPQAQTHNGAHAYGHTNIHTHKPYNICLIFCRTWCIELTPASRVRDDVEAIPGLRLLV